MDISQEKHSTIHMHTHIYLKNLSLWRKRRKHEETLDMIERLFSDNQKIIWRNGKDNLKAVQFRRISYTSRCNEAIVVNVAQKSIYFAETPNSISYLTSVM